MHVSETIDFNSSFPSSPPAQFGVKRSPTTPDIKMCRRVFLPQVSAAVAQVGGDAENVWQRNVQTTRKIGVEAMRRGVEACLLASAAPPAPPPPPEEHDERQDER